jgi:hypothetical protein
MKKNFGSQLNRNNNPFRDSVSLYTESFFS